LQKTDGTGILAAEEINKMGKIFLAVSLILSSGLIWGSGAARRWTAELEGAPASVPAKMR
jgi:hypothetical protein